MYQHLQAILLGILMAGAAPQALLGPIMRTRTHTHNANMCMRRQRRVPELISPVYDHVTERRMGNNKGEKRGEKEEKEEVLMSPELDFGGSEHLS